MQHERKGAFLIKLEDGRTAKTYNNRIEGKLVVYFSTTPITLHDVCSMAKPDFTFESEGKLISCDYQLIGFID